MQREIEQFKTKEFMEWIKESFIGFQNAFSNNDLKKLMYLESSLLFERDSEIIRANIAAKRREVRDCIIINYIKILEYQKAEDREILKVSMENYVYDVLTKEIISGVKEYKKTNKYILTFGKLGINENKTKIKCMGCGASLNISATGKCEYCGNIYYSELYNWLIEDIEILDEEK